MTFMVLEAGVGAALVLLELVADDASIGRALILGVHLVNTFLLLAALALVARRSGTPPDLPEPARDPATPRRLGLVALGLLVVAGASGAIAALGDTLFPAGTLAEALAQDLSETAHLLVRLRVGHPVLAVSAAVAVLVFVARRRMAAPERPAPWAAGAATLAVLQCLVGLANVALLAPLALQLVHLLIADLLWIATVLAVDD